MWPRIVRSRLSLGGRLVNEETSEARTNALKESFSTVSKVGIVADRLPRSSSLSARARERIRAGLTSGEIQSGNIYSVPSLAAALGVSATPVREAMLELTAEGLFRVIPNRGFTPVALSDRDLDEILELRLLLEVPATGMVARVISAKRLEHSKAIAIEIEQSAAVADVPRFLEADRRFHLALLEALENARLINIVARLRDQTRLFGLTNLAERGKLGGSAAEHMEILDAMYSRDSRLVRQLTKKHLKHTRGIWAGRAERA